jgi:hypothetical protein
MGTFLLVTVPASATIVRNSGTPNRARWLGCGVAETESEELTVAPERKRSARDYEQALRRQELAAGRALVQALPAEGPPGARELAAAKRVLTQALFELRRLGRDLDEQIEGLRSRQPGPARSGQSAQGRPAPSRGAGPGELDRFEAVRNAVEEVAERWEGRRDQLGAELDRRQPRQGQGQRPAERQSQGGRGQGRGREGARGREGVRNRGAAAPARPERPRSPRSRRSPG